AGAFLLSSGGRGLKLQPGDGLELIGAGIWAMHVIVAGKFASRFEPVSFSVGQLLICGVLNFATGMVVEAGELAKLGQLVIPVAYTALFALGLGYTLQIWAQRHTPPADAALILGLESVFAALAGWLVLRESLTAIQIVGCLLIFAAVIASQVRPRVSV
ncbi:MAG TPA: DMT family transporter, partial [Anaerolineales bacterium]